MANIDNLNFKVIIDDKDFNTRVKADIELAKKLNVELSNLLQAKVRVNSISAQEAASAKRASDILTKQAVDQEKISQAKAKTAEAEEKVATQAAKTTKELEKANAATSQTAVNVQRLATETQRTAAATNQAAVNEQRLRTETQRTATETQRTATATQNAANATARAELAQRRLRDYSSQTTRHIQTQSRILNELKGYALGYLSVHGASQLLSSLVRVTGEFELQKSTLAAMLGDLDKAEQIITKIQGLAVESPFQFKELTTYAKQLSAFSVPAQELYDTTKMLADVSAGLGVGMDRIVLAYGQVRSAAFLRGQEVRQFTEAGIPILNELAKQFSELEGRVVSTNEVFDKISKRLVPFEMVAKVFKDMTSEGGKFFNMQEVQAETLKGKISNLKDAYEVMLNEIGKGQSENLKGAVDWARQLMQNYEQTGRVLVELVVAYGAYKTALLAVTLATGTFDKANHKLIASLSNLGTWISKNPYVLIAAGLAATGYAVYKAATGLQGYEKIQRATTEYIAKYNVESAKEVSNLDALYAKLNMATEGTEEYDKARKRIYTEYASYISQLKEEGIAVDNLATIYGNLKTKIEESVRARFRNTGAQSITQTYEAEMDSIYKRFEHMVTRYQRMAKRELTFDEKEGLWQYILGNEEAWKRAEVEGLRNIVNKDTYNKYQVDLIKKNVQEIVSAYQEGKAKLADVLGEDTTETTTTTNLFPYDLEPVIKGKSPAQKAIEERIRAIQKLQDAYEKLIPYLNEVQMKSTLKSLFPNISEGVIDSLDFRAELERLADELARFDEDAAQRLKDTVGKDVAGTIADSFKAVEQYRKMLDSWLGEDFDLSGEGVSFDISKIIHNLNNEYAKIDEKRAKALDLLNKAQMGDEVALAKVREVLGEEAWQKYLVNGSRVIDELAARERRAAKQTADEKIRDLADKYIKEQMSKRNINLTEFEDKTLQQIQKQIDKLKDMKSDAQEALNKIYQGGVSESEIGQMELYEEIIKRLGIIIEDTGEELGKQIVDRIKVAADSLADLGSSIEKLGEGGTLARLGSGLSKAAEEFSGLVDQFGELGEALDAKDTIALIANLASYAISEVTDIITAAYERQRVLNEASAEYAEILRQIRRESYSGIFGTDEMGLAAENAKILAEEQKKYADTLEKFQKTKFQQFGGSFWRKDSISNTIADFAGKEGWDLYLENGELNIAALEAYYDAYSSRLTKKQRDLVSTLIEQGNILDDAASQQAEYLTNLFNGVADNIADGMINAFLESGDAAMDMGNIISDVSRQMVADLIKSVYLMPILDSYRKEFAAIDANTALDPTERTEQQLAVLDNALQQISGQSDNITATIERFEEYLRAGEGEEGTTDLGQGIKGITEDQANLLASYLNAIRADVAYSKTLWVRMDANLQRIADMFTSSPTLMEYQAQIAANTYNTATATQQILAELRSVVTTDSGDTAIRVYS